MARPLDWASGQDSGASPSAWRTNSVRNQAWNFALLGGCAPARAAAAARQNSSARSSSSTKPHQRGAVARGMCTTRSVDSRCLRQGRLDLLDADALAQVPVERAEQVGQALGQRVVATRARAPAAAPRGAARGSAAGTRCRGARGTSRMWTRTRSRVGVRLEPGVVDTGDRAGDARVLGELGAPARTRRPCRRPRSPHPTRRRTRATMLSPRPKVSSRSSVSGRSSGSARQDRRLERGVAHLDPRVLDGAAHPDLDRRLAVQQGVGDQLGDPQLGALGQLVTADVRAQARPPSDVRRARRGARAQGEGGRLQRHGGLQAGRGGRLTALGS